ncbi:MAG: radical SAM protein [Pseudonocardiales bacterium]|nr:TIGR03936 family radical SAM-associated protein [Actinomycetota bacterium]PZS20564.1 MAG: radical SAM protein [Pseudonocardiales bacterium]
MSPNPSAAPVCKVRLCYAKRGKLRFTSHRDVARAFERALRRAGLPMAYSQGFHPHPKVSWVGAAPTGAASEAEYVEIALVEHLDPEMVRARIDAALPDGLAVLEGVVAGPGSLAERIDASAWRIEVRGVAGPRLRQAADLLLAAPELLVERVTKDGLRSLDARAAIVSLEVEDDSRVLPAPDQLGRCGILVAVVRQVSPAVRPDDVLSALGAVAGLPSSALVKAIRTAQGRLDDDGGLVDPLAADRASARTAAAGKALAQSDDGSHQLDVARYTG